MRSAHARHVIGIAELGARLSQPDLPVEVPAHRDAIPDLNLDHAAYFEPMCRVLLVLDVDGAERSPGLVGIVEVADVRLVPGKTVTHHDEVEVRRTRIVEVEVVGVVRIRVRPTRPNVPVRTLIVQIPVVNVTGPHKPQRAREEVCITRTSITIGNTISISKSTKAIVVGIGV